MFDTALIGKVAGVISLVAFVPYIATILRGQTKPNRASWLIWTVVGTMIASSYWASGARHTIWLPLGYVIGPFVVLLLSIGYGKGGWTWLDRYCLFGAGISLVIWWTFGSPIIALLMNIFIDFMGVLPTVRKIYREPKTEDQTAWLISTLASAINLFAIEKYEFAIAIYPFYAFLGNGLIALLILVRQRQT